MYDDGLVQTNLFLNKKSFSFSHKL